MGVLPPPSKRAWLIVTRSSASSATAAWPRLPGPRLRHQRPVALKVLHPELAHALGPERFLREIERPPASSTPTSCRCTTPARPRASSSYVMPYVEGESCGIGCGARPSSRWTTRSRSRARWPTRSAYAHGHGVIHRDIKPENILLERRQRAGGRLRDRAGAGPGGADATDRDRDGRGHPRLHEPGAGGAASQIDGRSRHLQPGLRAVRDAGRRAALHRADAAGHHRQALHRAGAARCGTCATACRRVEHAVTRALAPVPADRFASAAEFARALRPTTPPAPTTRLVAAGSSSGPARPATGAGGRDGLGARRPYRARRAVRLAAKPPRAETAPRSVLAVLPFENLGDSADAYFADGVANDLRTKLSQVAGLAVIARGSSNEYRQTTKSPAADRPGAGRRLPAHRHRPMGEGRGRREPGPGDAGAGGRARRARAANPLGAVSSTPR